MEPHRQASLNFDETGAQTYNLTDAGPAIFEKESATGVCPNWQRPVDQMYWFQFENERLKFEVSTGLLRRVEDVRRDMAEVMKGVVNTLETLPDILKRDFAFSPEKPQPAPPDSC